MTHHKRKIPNSVAVLVLGIASIPTCFCLGIIGLACGIISLVLHGKGMAQFNANPDVYDETNLGMMKAGKICAIIGICLSALYLIFYIANIFFIATGASNPFEELYRGDIY